MKCFVPVLPLFRFAEPLVSLDGGRFATSDLANDLYGRRVINRRYAFENDY